jgi:class 3 adenylate cyclase
MMGASMRLPRGEAPLTMKRRISAILAADIVGYSKLVAEDEEETVRRLVVWRAAFDEFTTRYGGRIVNTVGDAILAEFPSSVDAVRCAMDVHESIRARNLAYPVSRQMNFRIGITVGDVVDREGQLFGDGVNIAARLEGLAPAGGICVSRTVYEQVANKLSVKLDDIGHQPVKNLPDPVHAYMIAAHSSVADAKGKPQKQGATVARTRWLAGSLVAIVLIVALAVALQLYRPQPAPHIADVPPPTPSPASLASADVTRHFDEEKVRALAATQSIPLPPALKVLAPAAIVPASITEYLGAWGGDKRWRRGGRQALLIVESVDSAGVALGVYAHGAPLNPGAANRPARFGAFAGSITDNGLSFAWGPSKYLFKLMPDGSMWGKWEPGGEQGQFDLTITLQRIE